MEIFKTQVGSWIYPEPNFFRDRRRAAVLRLHVCLRRQLSLPRVAAVRFRVLPSSAPPRPGRAQRRDLSQFLQPSLHRRPALAAVCLAGWLFFRTRVYFRVWRHHRSMPLLLGLALVSLFIWFSENIGTFTKTWLYPSQRHGWSMVSIDKLGSWFLLLIISYTLVSLINAPRAAARSARSRGLAHARLAGRGLRGVDIASRPPARRFSNPAQLLPVSAMRMARSGLS